MQIDFRYSTTSALFLGRHIETHHWRESNVAISIAVVSASLETVFSSHFASSRRFSPTITLQFPPLPIMRFTGFLLAAAAHGALAAPQGPSEPVFSCGTPKPSAEHRKMMEKFATDEAAFAASGNITARQVITVDTYFHVVASRNSVLSGLLSVRIPAGPLLL